MSSRAATVGESPQVEFEVRHGNDVIDSGSVSLSSGGGEFTFVEYGTRTMKANEYLELYMRVTASTPVTERYGVEGEYGQITVAKV